MRLAFALAFCLLGSSALAQECDKWKAGMEEDEGGPRMMASICTQATSSTSDPQQHYLFVQCGSTDSLSLRYMPFADGAYPPGGNEEYKTKMTYAIGDKSFAFDGHFEGMDGAMVTDTGSNPAFIDAIKTGKELRISDAAGTEVPAATFTLQGAGKALETLVGACE